MNDESKILAATIIDNIKIGMYHSTEHPAILAHIGKWCAKEAVKWRVTDKWA